MFRFSVLAAGCVALALSLAPERSRAAPAEMYQGKIAAIADRMLTVISQTGDNFTFAVGPNCMIQLDGKQVALAMLGVGNTVRISATQEGDRRTANEIDARSR